MYSRLKNKRIKRKVQENGSRKNRLPESFQERKVRSMLYVILLADRKSNNAKCGSIEQGINHCILVVYASLVSWNALHAFCIASYVPGHED